MARRPSAARSRGRVAATTDIRLTTTVAQGGCGCKLPRAELTRVLSRIGGFPHPWVSDATGPMEDAALLLPTARFGLVFTVDFFTPVVDDPETFGAVSAANALSDVYAMGGTPQAALAVCGFPADRMPLEVLERVFRGGRDKAAEAGCAVVGGHTIRDPELKYGLCVIGSVDPRQAIVQTTARPGDALVLTKPIGTGIVAQAVKRGIAPPDVAQAAIVSMTTLNAAARDAAVAAGVRAGTDVTGFGLLGHLQNLVAGSGVAARIDASAVPLLPGVRSLAEAGVVPGGSRGNLTAVATSVRFARGVDESTRLLLADAQTSGGLLLAVRPRALAKLLRELRRRGAACAEVIGEVVVGRPGRIEVVAGRGSAAPAQPRPRTPRATAKPATKRATHPKRSPPRT